MAANNKAKRKKLSDVIVDDVMQWIVRERKQPGDRLPNERKLIDQFGMSKGTVREALKALEVRGLIETRTGPSGGAYLRQMSREHAAEPLRNFLHFHDLDGHDIYQLRKALEPELAVSVVDRLDEQDFALLQDTIIVCAHEPENDEELRIQREAELEFHNILALRCPNPILAFVCSFLNDLLRDLMVYRNAMEHEHFGARNVAFHLELLAAFRARDAERVRLLMTEHMEDAEVRMHEMEAHVGRPKLLLPIDKT